MERLRSLAIKLGGIRPFEGVEAKASIRKLELWQISGLERVEAIGSLPGRQNLFLQSLPRVQTMPHLTGSRSLRRVVLENMKGLADFSVFESAPALEQFALLDGGGQQPEQLLPVLRNPVLSHANAGFGSARRNEPLAKLRAAHGKEAWDVSEPFPYVEARFAWQPQSARSATIGSIREARRAGR